MIEIRPTFSPPNALAVSIVDFHNHVIPSVDDGSDSLELSLEALEKMFAQGITCVIATPHFRASIVNDESQFSKRIAEIDQSWDALRAAAKEALPALRLERGVELALDEPLGAPPDPRVRLAGTRFMLVEFPYFSIPAYSRRALSQLRQLGVTPIIAHPERYRDISDSLSILGEWKASGAFLQLNAGSVIGAYGKRIESIGWRLLERGLADYLSSDFHCRGDCWFEPAAKRLIARNATDQLRILSETNGSRLLKGLDPMAVSETPRPASWWQRLMRTSHRFV